MTALICLGVFPVLTPAQSGCDPACGENQHCDPCTCPSDCDGWFGYCDGGGPLNVNQNEECCVKYFAGGSCECDEGQGFTD